MNGQSLLALALAFTLAACASPTGPDDGTASTSSSASTGASSSSSGAGGGTGGAPDSPDGTWDLTATISLNGHDIAHEIQSAVSYTVDFGGQPMTAVVLTNQPHYCEALQSKACLPEGTFLVEMTLAGTEPGDYPLGSAVDQAPHTVSAFLTPIDADCVGAGLGASDGGVKVTEISLDEGGGVDVTLDLGFFGGALTGTVEAPFCAL
ncbi:MAG: hypothetical protein U0414_18760 [Polyangiaceae bacterium]